MERAFFQMKIKMKTKHSHQRIKHLDYIHDLLSENNTGCFAQQDIFLVERRETESTPKVVLATRIILMHLKLSRTNEKLNKLNDFYRNNAKMKTNFQLIGFRRKEWALLATNETPAQPARNSSSFPFDDKKRVH